MEYSYVVQKIAEMVFNHGNRKMDFDDCLDYADGIYHDLGAERLAQFAGLLFLETDESIEVKRQADGAVVGSIEFRPGGNS